MLNSKVQSDAPVQLTLNEIHKKCIEIAAQSPCAKRKVGAVLAVQEDSLDVFHLLATGYNYSMDGGSCECENGETKDTVVHAEVSCIKQYEEDDNWSLAEINFSYFGIDKRPIMFITHEPCNGCKAALLQANVSYEVVGEFMKFDSGKARISLVPKSFNEAAARALAYGAKKYKVDNWRNVDSLERYIDALYRHLGAYVEAKRSGDAEAEIDADSGLHELDCAAANLSFIIDLKHLPLRKEGK